METFFGITVASDDDTTTHTRLFSASCLSIFIFLISSLLCFPGLVYVLLPELPSVNKLLVL